MNSTENDGQDAGKKTSASTKWIVIGVIAVVFMIIFQDEIKHLLKNAEEVSVTAEGIKIKTRTVETPLGKTVLSNKAVEMETSAEQPNNINTYVDNINGFSLNWPQDGTWIRDDNMAANIGVAFFVHYYQSFGDFTPNVNVTYEVIGNMNLEDWLAIGHNSLQQMGWEIQNLEIDEELNAGVQVIRNRNYPGGLFQIQRFILKDDVAYIATASKLEIDNTAFPNLYSEMGQILNSFQVL